MATVKFLMGMAVWRAIVAGSAAALTSPRRQHAPRSAHQRISALRSVADLLAATSKRLKSAGPSRTPLDAGRRNLLPGHLNVRALLTVAATMCRLPHKESHMATNLAIDPDLLDRAVLLSGEKTKKAVVTKALQEFIARREQRRVVELIGTLEWDESFDYKAERSRS
jgi:hypothetical protein